jgi:proline iminopeptidase
MLEVTMRGGDGNARTTTFRTDGAMLHVREVGDGRPIVILHGGPDFDHEYLLPEMDRLADLGRLVYYAQRGRGRSYAGEGPDDVSIEGDIADLDAVRARTGSDRVAVLGHSWGALLAMEYATRHPERVSHLILLNPAPASHADLLALQSHFARIRSPEQRARMAALAADPRYVAGDVAMDAEYYAIHFAAAFRHPENLTRVLDRLRRGFAPEGIVAARAIEDRLYEQTWRAPTYDLLPSLRTLRVPALVLHGDHDFIPLAVAQHIAEAVPGSRLLELTDCGHFSHLEQPEAVHAAVADLLEPA